MPTSNYAQISGLITSLGLDPAVDCRVIRDADGNFVIEPGSWRSQNIPQPTEEEIDAFSPSPVTDVDIMYPVFTDARRQAALFLDHLKAQVWDHLKNVANMNPADVTEAGVTFNLSSETGIGVAYDDFVKNGGHPVAALALWNRIQEVKSHYAWLTTDVEAIFATALGQS